MVAKPAASPTPAQVAMYGHIAARLRAFLAEKRWSPGDLNEAMGIKRSNTQVYGWINCRGTPGPVGAQRLAKAMGIRPGELMEKPSGEAGALTVLPAKPLPPRPLDVLQFAVQSDGNARIRLDCVLPFDKATPLLRTLLDAGLVVIGTKVEDD